MGDVSGFGCMGSILLLGWSLPLVDDVADHGFDAANYGDVHNGDLLLALTALGELNAIVDFAN